MNKIYLVLIVVLFFSCKNNSDINQTENNSSTLNNSVKENKNDESVNKNIQEKTEYQKLIIGSWYNYETASGENIAFNDDGTFDYYANQSADNGTWKIEGNTLTFFENEFKIIELTLKKLVIEDKYGKSTYHKME